SFVAEHAGYARVKILRLQEPEGLHESQNLTLIDVLSGVSPDYSIVAQKTAAKTALKKFDVAFSREYGVMLNEIANLYDGQLKIKTDDLKTKWSDEHQRAEQLAVEANQYHLEKETTKQEFLLALMEKETRLQEVTATGIENKQQIDKLHVSLIDSQEQQQALKTALKEIGQQRLQLETQLDDQLSKKEDAINWLNKELQTLYNSKSWRITWPLRKSMLFFKWLFVLPIDIILCLVHLPRRIGRNILIKVIKHVSKSSKLRSTLVLRLNRYPNIKVRLKPFIIHNGLGALVPTPAVNKENEACENDIYHESILDFKADHLNNNLGTGECLGQSRITDGVNQEKKTPLEKWFY
ncbi:MAG: O-antigen chain-terminating methyltransferase, partial [Roseivirga sp.]